MAIMYNFFSVIYFDQQYGTDVDGVYTENMLVIAGKKSSSIFHKARQSNYWLIINLIFNDYLIITSDKEWSYSIPVVCLFVLLFLCL